ncbi:MAG: protein-(glutamine-N5) methyltransferase, release factor-specific [Opitutae bacterium]|nr:protein-(glutamine-N5) methyltransferase, release factor-specific [Opitutae bacterium]
MSSDSQTVKDMLATSSRRLSESTLQDPTLDAEWIMAHVLQVSRLRLGFLSDREISSSESKAISTMLDRRISREPLQYVLGSVTFANLDLKVDSRALIPRPETEQFLEIITESIKEPPSRIIDLGTGSGALALSLAQSFPKAEVLAVDRCESALSLAQENMERNGLTNRIQLLQGDWFADLEGTFDLIVSNPPYLDETEWFACEPEIRDFEPRQALVADSPSDSSGDLKQILVAATSRIRPRGTLALETGEGHHKALSELANSQGFARCRGFSDLRGLPRFFFAWAPD